MSDNEIVKALEVCGKYAGFNDCEKRPLKSNCDVNVLETLALDLINRQKAEINLLHDELHSKVEYIHEQRDVINEKKAEIEALKDQEQRAHNYCKNTCEPKYKAEIKMLQTEIKLLTENGVTAKYPHCAFLDTGIFLSKEPNGYEKWNAYVRNQAYKEVANSVTDLCYKEFGSEMPVAHTFAAIVECVLDNLLKEMVGEQRKEDEGK